jgi:hypothetical protein
MVAGRGGAFQGLDGSAGLARCKSKLMEREEVGFLAFFLCAALRGKELQALNNSLTAVINSGFAGFAHVPLTAFNLL